MTENSTVTLEIEVTRETESDLKEIIAEKGWEFEEGLRLLLAAGMGYRRIESAQLESATGKKEDEYWQRIMRRLVDIESSLAATRFRLFEAQQANSSWELSTGAVEMESTGMKGLLQMKNLELGELKETVAMQRSEIESLRTQLEIAKAGFTRTVQPEKDPYKDLSSWKKWLLKLIGVSF